MMQNMSNNRFSDKLNEYFRENMKLTFVSKQSVIIVTNNDECYEFRRKDYENKIKNSLIALSDDILKVKPLIEQSLVEELSNKQVVDFKNGFQHLIARTINGKVYSCDYKRWITVGKKNKFCKMLKISKPKINKFLLNEHIIDICCGAHHTLVLTLEGDVYSWGKNDCGQIGNGLKNKYQLKPYKLNDFNGEKVKRISCGSKHSMALTDRGRVYSWGWNDWGQLGIGNKENSHSPKLLEMSELQVIQKISCGYGHSLLLSIEEEIYFCGWNWCGGLGFGDLKRISTPSKLSHTEKFIDIATNFDRKFFAALSKNLVLYNWGNCGNKKITEVQKTEFNSFNYIFEHYFRITYESINKTLIRFDDDFIVNGKYAKKFNEITQIGSGSYGEVFKACHKKNEYKKFAIKKVLFRKNCEECFMKELESSHICFELKHRNIVKYWDVWLENGIEDHINNFVLYIQMELCDKSLNKIIDEIKDNLNLFSNKTLTPLGYYIASEIFIQILQGVNYLHSHDKPILHRDLKPCNIMLKIDKQSDNIVKIADLGLATIHRYANQIHSQDRGDINYIAPEATDSTHYDERADIYSLGKIAQNLFFIDIKRDYNILNESESKSGLTIKYLEISNLSDQMSRYRVYERPANIVAILEKKSLWAMEMSEYKLNEEFTKVFQSNENSKSCF